jgi:nucleotide-binding universal stress UspA family protein
MENKKNIMLVPVDFSEISLNALHHAAQIAKHFNNDLVLLSILEDDFLSSIFSFSKSEMKDNLAKEAMLNRLNEKAKERLKKIAEENPDKIKEYARRAYLKRKEKLKQKDSENI